MDGFEKELETIIVMGEARQSLDSLCRVYRQSVLEDEDFKHLPLEGKQFAMAESLTKGFFAVVRKLGFSDDRIVSGMMANFMLPLMTAIHELVTKDGEK